MSETIIYTRQGCHLCQEAEDLLRRHGLSPRLVDVDADPELRKQYDHCVPVVVIGWEGAISRPRQPATPAATARRRSNSMTDCLIVGAGVVGLSLAYELASRVPACASSMRACPAPNLPGPAPGSYPRRIARHRRRRAADRDKQPVACPVA